MEYVSGAIRRMFGVVFSPLKKLWRYLEEIDRETAEYLDSLSKEQREIMLLSLIQQSARMGKTDY